MNKCINKIHYLALGPSIFANVKGFCLMLNITLFRHCAFRSYKRTFIVSNECTFIKISCKFTKRI